MPSREAGTQPLRLLVVDDDPKFRSFVSAGLRQSGHHCEVAEDGEEALRLTEDPERAPFDIVLLDVMMPAKSGWDFLAELRAKGRDTPVVFVTARDAVDERVRGLQLGADDYVIKPFAFSELLARIDAVARRRVGRSRLDLDGLTLDLDARRLSSGDRTVDLTPREFDLLRALCQARGHYVSRTALLRDVWGMDFDPGTNIVEVHVARLRRKLEACGSAPIRTKRGQGYAIEVGGERGA